MHLDDLSDHHRHVRSLVVALVGDLHAGEDAVQDAWVRALDSEQSHAIRDLRRWLTTTARRLAANESRGKARRRDREEAMARLDHVPSSAEIAARVELSQRLVAEVEQLDELHASVLRDRYFGDLSVSTIAERDGVTEQAMRSRLRRARAALRARLESVGLGGNTHWTLGVAPLLAAPHPVTTPAGWSPATALAASLTMKKLTPLVPILLLAGTGVLTWHVTQEPEDPSESRPTEPDALSPVGAAEVAEATTPVDTRQRLVVPSNDSTRAGLVQPSQDIAAEPAPSTPLDVVVDAESKKQAEYVALLERMRNEVLSKDPQIQHGAAYALLGAATASILKSQGRVGRSGGGSMRQEYPSERVVGINDAVYRFDSVEFPAWDELNAFYDAHPDRQDLPSLPDELAYMIADLAEQAIVIERGK